MKAEKGLNVIQELAAKLRENVELQSEASKLLTGVYLIYCSADGLGYIGSARESIEGREYNHGRAVDTGTHKNQHLQRAWDKYGEDMFEVLVVETCPKEIALEREQYYLDLYFDTGLLFNMSRRATGGSGPRSEESKIKQAAAMKNYWSNPKFRERQAASMNSYWADPEKREEQSARILKFFENPEEIEKLSEINTLRYKDPAARQKMSASQQAAYSGPNGHFRKEKLSALSTERFSDPDERAKLSVAQKAAWAKNPERRAAVKEACTKAWEDPDLLERHSDMLRRSWTDSEIRERRVSGLRMFWSDPVLRERQSNILKASWARRKAVASAKALEGPEAQKQADAETASTILRNALAPDDTQH